MISAMQYSDAQALNLVSISWVDWTYRPTGDGTIDRTCRLIVSVDDGRRWLQSG